MSFKELVTSYYNEQTTWSELIKEIKCESCFTSVFDELTEQFGIDSKANVMLADEFPDHYKSYIKAKGLS